MKRVIVLGAGGNCVDIAETIDAINEHAGASVLRFEGFLDDDRAGSIVGGRQVIGPLTMAGMRRDCFFVNGIGSPGSFRAKESILRSIDIPADRYLTLVHPSASVSPSAALGQGVVVLPLVTVASHAKIGDHVIVLSNSVINHGVVVGDYSCIASGVCLSGDVRVGRSCYLGTNSAVIGNVRVGDHAMVGMGSVVLQSVEPGATVVGNPAREIRSAT